MAVFNQREMTEKTYLMLARRRFIIGVSIYAAALLALPLLIFLLMSRP